MSDAVPSPFHAGQRLSVVPWSPPARERQLVEAIGRIHCARDEAGVLQAAVHAVERTIAGAASALFQVDPDAQVVSLRAAGPRWRTAERDTPAWLTREAGGIADFARGGGACAGRWWRRHGDAPGDGRDIARMRVSVADRLWGMLVVVGPSSDSDRAEDAWFVEALTAHVGLALGRASRGEGVSGAVATVPVGREQAVGHVGLDMLGQLASGVGHEFNNTLTSILGVTEWLVSTRSDDQELVEELGTMRESAKAAAGLIRRLQCFSRRRAIFQREATPLGDLVFESLDVVRPYLSEFNQREHASVRVTIDTEDEVSVDVDAGGMREVLVNLLTNAIDASAAGGEIVIRTGREQHEAFVAVVDHGTGLDDSTRRHMFDPFFSTKGRRGGGLGLPLCLSVVESHGGRIAVATTHGVGSTFTVWLPLAPQGRGIESPVPCAAHTRPAGADVMTFSRCAARSPRHHD